MAGTTDWTNADQNGTKYEISEVVIHPENANNRNIDLALIKVKEEIVFSDTIQSIDLPTADVIKPLYVLKISAWGSSNTVSFIYT